MAFADPTLAPPPGLVVPLARRPWWLWLLLLPMAGPLAGALLGAGLPLAARWGWAAFGVVALVATIWSYARLAVADYDANYLYHFTRAGAERLALGSFYKLRNERGFWRLYYRDEQGRTRTLQLLPLHDGVFRPRDSASIHGFIDAVWQHNPQLDVRH